MYDMLPWSTPISPLVREAECSPVLIPCPPASTPIKFTEGLLIKELNRPIELLPPPTQAITKSGREPSVFNI